MKISFLVGAAAGYVLGTRAGRARYETIARLSRAAWGSQPARTVAGAAQSEADEVGTRLRHAIGRMLTHDAPSSGQPTTIDYPGPSHPVGTVPR